MLQMIELTNSLFVSAQPDPADLAELAAQGFKTVVCNRPDDETASQPSMDEMAAAAQAAGMTFVRYPVNPSTFPGDDLAAIGKVFDSGEKTFAYCRTGTRCTNLWVASRSTGDKASAQERARALGYDLSLSERLG